jgi:hypothetical protein
MSTFTTISGLTGRRKWVDLFRAAQAELEPLKGTRVLGAERNRLWQAQWAIACSDSMTTSEAKALQLDASSAPLTVCFGHLWTPTVRVPGPVGESMAAGTFHRHGDGCGLVYPDSTSTRGQSPFRIYCPDCSSTATRRGQSAQARAVAFASGREQIVHGDGVAWFGHCSSCGEPFVNGRPDATRCDRCR